MAADIETTSPRSFYNARTYVWMLTTLILTPLTAGFLAATGHIPFDIQMAVLDGFLVALVYIGFRVFTAERQTRLAARMDSA
jgi:hypothetical protein